MRGSTKQDAMSEDRPHRVETPFSEPGEWDRCPGPESLTPRQRDIAALIRRGLRSREVARQLKITPELLATELDEIYSRLGLSDKLSLTLYAAHYGLDARK